jgi:AmmeMemoRadiSam system protein A
MPTPMRERPGADLVRLARSAVEAHLDGSATEPTGELVAAFPEAAGVFVTIRRDTGELRGCIGTPMPVCPDVPHEIARVAPLAATADPRFPPVAFAELASHRFEVSLLTPPEAVGDVTELDPLRYGIIVEDDLGRRALLLPDIPGIDTVERQLYEIRRKAGIPERAPIRLQRFEVVKFEEPLRPS